VQYELRDIVDEKLVRKLASELKEKAILSSADEFVSECMHNWSDLSLNQRINAISNSLLSILPQDYEAFRAIVLDLAPKFKNGYENIFIPEAIGVRGIEFPERALEDLAFVTEFSTSEFAIRAYIERYEALSMGRMLAWTKDENEHVRRLASEGCRPSLPWGKALKKFQNDPTSIFPILEALMNDSSLYVRKSVANNLNDISKFHPEQVISFAKAWKGRSEEVDWILKRALRSLLKEGRPAALSLFGYGPATDFVYRKIGDWPSMISLGSDYLFQFEITNKSQVTQLLRLEYKVGFLRAKGQHNFKTFQIAETKLKAADSKVIQKKQQFKVLSTRKLYPGTHKIKIVLNGVEIDSGEFRLTF